MNFRCKIIPPIRKAQYCFFTVKIVNTSDFLEHGVYILDLLLVE